MDLGRPPEARFPDGEVILAETPVTESDLQYVTERVGEFGDDNRAGIERTLHRISAVRNRRGRVIGLTCRVGRAVYGTVALIRDVIEQGRSLLILGRPGVGKTTMLRETARVLADDLGKRVVIVDTSNEIAGDGDVPHPGIGRARRLQVARPAEQHAVMIEAVENHMPEVIIIDEIGTELEAQAARTIAERGVQLVGTAHGNTLDNLLLNPTLSDLVGGIGSVTLGDEEAKRRGTQKSVLERKAPPTFDVVVEQQERLRVLLHADVAAAVDALLRGEAPPAEVRTLTESGHLHREMVAIASERTELGAQARGTQFEGGRRRRGSGADRHTPPMQMRPIAMLAEELPPVVPQGRLLPLPPLDNDDDPVVNPLVTPRQDDGYVHLLAYGLNRENVLKVAQALDTPVLLVNRPEEADVIIAHQHAYERQREKLRAPQYAHIPIAVLRGRNADQLRAAFGRIFGLNGATDDNDDDNPSWREQIPAEDLKSERDAAALQEAEDAIHYVLRGARDGVELTPQRSYIRRLQHLLAERYNVGSRSFGQEPNRRVRIFSAS